MAQSPFETMTPESLKNEMLARVKEKGVDIDAREGSYANVLLSEAAYVMWKYGQTLNGFMSIISRMHRAASISTCTRRRSA